MRLGEKRSIMEIDPSEFLDANYRVVSSEEFWRGCETAIADCKKAGFSEPLDELREKFLTIYLTYFPAQGRG